MPLATTPVYASRISRIGAQLVDSLIIIAPLALTFIVGAVSEVLVIITLIAALIFALGYYFFADCMRNGQSIGKRALDIAVVHAETGEPCTAFQSFLRNILLYVLGPIDWIFIFGSRHQRLGDMLAGTIVIEARDGVLP